MKSYGKDVAIYEYNEQVPYRDSGWFDVVFQKSANGTFTVLKNRFGPLSDDPPEQPHRLTHSCDREEERDSNGCWVVFLIILIVFGIFGSMCAASVANTKIQAERDVEMAKAGLVQKYDKDGYRVIWVKKTSAE